MKNLTPKILNLTVLLFAALFLSGCLSGGSSGSSAGSSEFAAVVSGGSGSSGAGSASASTGGTPVPPSQIIDEGTGGGTIPATTNPEPSSLLLLASGLMGMAVYTKTRLKNRKRS